MFEKKTDHAKYGFVLFHANIGKNYDLFIFFNTASGKTSILFMLVFFSIFL